MKCMRCANDIDDDSFYFNIYNNEITKSKFCRECREARSEIVYYHGYDAAMVVKVKEDL